MLVHTEDTQVLAAMSWAMIPVSINESLIETLQGLPVDWRELPAPLSTREVGTDWVAESRSAVLRVPSIVVDGEARTALVRTLQPQEMILPEGGIQQSDLLQKQFGHG